MVNPTIEELQNSEEYEQFAELSHSEIKEFVINQLTTKSTLITSFMIYQFAMIVIGLFFLTRSIVLAFHNVFEPLIYTVAAVVFTFSILIVIHELLHGGALKITGAQNLSFGVYWNKFIFYAEADRHVLNRKQFELVSLTPLVVVKLVTLIGIIWFVHQPAFYFFIFVMSAHSLFCAGDIGLLSVFYDDTEREVFTFDVKEEKQSYFYRERKRI